MFNRVSDTTHRLFADDKIPLCKNRLFPFTNTNSVIKYRNKSLGFLLKTTLTYITTRLIRTTNITSS